jgi:hypothetical protein
MTLQTGTKPPKVHVDIQNKIIYSKTYFVVHLPTAQMWTGPATCVNEAIEKADSEKGEKTGMSWNKENCFAHYICDEVEYPQ